MVWIHQRFTEFKDPLRVASQSIAASLVGEANSQDVVCGAR